MGAAASEQTILVVDDDDTLLRAYSRSLAESARLFTAATCDEARKIARNEHIDVAVVDLRLHAESGLDLVRDLKATFPNLRILLTSGFLNTEVTVAAVRAGAADVRHKPIPARALLQWTATGTWAELDDITTPTLERVQWEHIQRVVSDCGGCISEAARRLDIERATLRRHLRKNAPRR